MLTGDPKEINDFASEFNVIGIAEGGTISHNMKSILLDPNLKEVAQFKDNEWEPKQVLSHLKE